MSTPQWNDTFMRLFTEAVDRFHQGHTRWQDIFTAPEIEFLATIGYRTREMFDFVEDFAQEGDPSPTTALLVASVRRDFFLTAQRGIVSNTTLITVNELPIFGDEVHGIAYLPRIIKKAEGKLYGNLDPDIMYCCGGDRKFLREHGNIHPADFLRMIWGAKGDRQKIVTYVLNAMKNAGQEG